MSHHPRTRRCSIHLAAWSLLALAPLTVACGRDRSADATPPPPREDARPAPATPPADPATPQTPAADPARMAERQRELDRREAELDARERAIEERASSRPARASAPKPAPAAPAPRRAAPAPADEPRTVADPEPRPEVAPDAAPAPALPDDESWRRRPTDDRLEGASDETDPEAVAPRPESLRTYTLPAGTRLDAEIAAGLSSATAAAGDEVRARVRQPVVVDGVEVVPAGSEVVGEVTEAVPLGKVGGQARLVLDFHRLEPRGGDPVPIEAELATKGENETARDAATIGGAAVGGAVLGRVLNRGNKGKGTLIGAIVGAAAGTVIASRSAGEEVVLPAGARVQLLLDRPVEVAVRGTPPPR